MEDPELTKTITSKTTILRIVHDIYTQNAPLSIALKNPEEAKQFLSSISKIEEEHNQLILHQISPEKTGDWQEIIHLSQELEISCFLQLGAIKFMGKLSPLDDSEVTRYCRLSLPTQLSKTQMRSGFRVAMGKFESTATIELADGTEITGTCRDISLAGALFHFPMNIDRIKIGQSVNRFHVAIGDSLELSCNAKVCHLKSGARANNLLVGLNFQELAPLQLEAIQSAIIKLERLSISN